MGSRKCSSPQPQRIDELRVSLGDTVHEVVSKVVAAVVISNVVSDIILQLCRRHCLQVNDNT
jgi:ABC-type phosphate transport system permease subunit